MLKQSLGSVMEHEADTRRAEEQFLARVRLRGGRPVVGIVGVEVEHILALLSFGTPAEGIACELDVELDDIRAAVLHDRQLARCDRGGRPWRS
jgi:uncharacterized protein (DUF433 family)